MGTRVPKSPSAATTAVNLPSSPRGGGSGGSSSSSSSNHTIVSKRSVERLYFPDQPHFFKFFVSKFRRRTPLVNRGFFIRLQVVNVTVRHFLRRASSRPKIIVNLGCGSDALPWQCLSRYPDDCRGATFVDVDVPAVMAGKRDLVAATPELRAPLEALELLENSPLLLRSRQYCQISCDLCNLAALEVALSDVVSVSAADFLFVADDSITMLETASADALIRWASTIGHHAEFCLLEPIIPDGPDHPFAKQMMQHFGKLKTPSPSLLAYPCQNAQEKRFAVAGWEAARSWNLWQAWADDFFLSCSDRCRLDDVEPFDEWEELALFASHYALVHAAARSGPSLPSSSLARADADPSAYHSGHHSAVTMAYSELPQDSRSRRRFSASLHVKNDVGESLLASFLGQGPKDLQDSCDVYAAGQPKGAFRALAGGPPMRLCATLTDVGDGVYLLAGGRTSPSRPLRDAWVFHKDARSWVRTHDLPIPLYRHAVTRLGPSSLALLVGGKSGPRRVFDGCLLWHARIGWVECVVSSPLCRPLGVFGAVLACAGPSIADPLVFCGILAGGMKEDAVIANQCLRWQLDLSNLERPDIAFEPAISPLRQPDPHSTDSAALLARFGAASCQIGQQLLVVGGVVADRLLPQKDGILSCHLSADASPWDRVGHLWDPRLFEKPGVPRPLLIGSSAVALPAGEVVILGGGADCFSMGSFWTAGVYTLPAGHASAVAAAGASRVGGGHREALPWGFWKSVKVAPEVGAVGPHRKADSHLTSEASGRQISRLRLESAEHFGRLLQESRPVVLEGLDLGSCISRWNGEYLVRSVGPDRKVVVHEAQTPRMDFVTKNFDYVTKDFRDFMAEVAAGGRLYMRATSSRYPADRPASLEEDFPTLAPDFVLPPELAATLAGGARFSSVLRIQGEVTMWLHYDVMANIYCQIGGSKRFVLFPPSDVTHLSFAPGASSSNLDAFASLDSTPAGATHPHETTLSPGEVLFIPRFWPHAAAPTTPVNIAVNVFFRDLQCGYSPGRDVYGNRDLAAYEKGRQGVARVARAFADLPPDVRDFYIRRLAGEMLDSTLA